MYNNQQYGAPPPQQQWGAPPPPQQYGAPPGGQYGAPPPNQYGAPPPNQYGAPPSNQYGAPPNQYGGQPQQSYGAPPQQQQQQWGAPPPPNNFGGQPQQSYGQQSYGAPAPTGQYGAPPPNQSSYGAPPPPQQQYGGMQQGGPAPGMGGGPRFLGALIPAPPPALPTTQLQGYNPQFDADRIRKATKVSQSPALLRVFANSQGFGTDENTLINTLTPLDAFQIDILARVFEQQTGKPLKKTLEKELSSW